MIPRFICPHCHFSIDPLTLEAADCTDAQFRVCPECDEPVVLSSRYEDISEPRPIILPTVAATPASVAESLVL